jgi:hypothetical protein
MRAGTEAALARVVGVFGAARPHHACLFHDRMKVLVHVAIALCWGRPLRWTAGIIACPTAK